MNLTYGLSELLAEIQRALLAEDFSRLANAIGDARLEHCHFSEEALNSACIENYGRWRWEQKEYVKAIEIYQFIFSKRKACVIPSTINYYQSALIHNGQKQKAIEIGWEAIQENRANAKIYRDVADDCLAKGRYEEAKSLLLQAKDKLWADSVDIDGKVRSIDGILEFASLWNKIKTSNFTLPAEVAENPPKLDFELIRMLANSGADYLAVQALDAQQPRYEVNEFLSHDAVAAGIAFQSKPFDGAIHEYLYDAIQTGAMSYLCPQTGERVKSTVSMYIDNVVFAYYFNAKTPFFLFTMLNTGRKNGLYFPANETYLYFDAKKVCIHSCIRLKYILTLNWPVFKGYFEGRNSLAVVTNIYDHWGHMLLNEYQSLDYLVERGIVDKKTKIVSGADTFVTIKDIFNIDFDSEAQIDDNEAINEYIARNNLFVVRPTNLRYRLSLSLRNRVLKNSIRLCGETVRQRFNQADFAFVVWCELRNNDRICLNQAELACAVVSHLDAKAVGKTAVLLAGWSGKLGADRESNERLIAQDTATAHQIAENIASVSDAACFNVIGQTLYEKIVWAERADIHIATFGSGILFAYIANKPLIMHANTGWYAEIASTVQIVDEPVALRYMVEKEFITDRDTQHYWRGNYECNPAGLIKQLDKVLAEREVSR